jgi:putative FmdB family regulatory protein
MPLLEYRCGACGKKTEDLVLAGDAPTAPSCSACGSMDVTRLLSSFAAHAHSGGGPSLPCGAGDPGDCGMGGGACGMGGGGCGAMDGGGWDA